MAWWIDDRRALDLRALADELRTVADHVGATQGLGVSMGAGALCSLLERTLRRFERLVLGMPAVLDLPRTDDALDRLLEMAQRVDDCDLDGLTALLPEGEPVSVRGRRAVPRWR